MCRRMTGHCLFTNAQGPPLSPGAYCQVLPTDYWLPGTGVVLLFLSIITVGLFANHSMEFDAVHNSSLPPRHALTMPPNDISTKLSDCLGESEGFSQSFVSYRSPPISFTPVKPEMSLPILLYDFHAVVHAGSNSPFPVHMRLVPLIFLYPGDFTVTPQMHFFLPLMKNNSEPAIYMERIAAGCRPDTSLVITYPASNRPVSRTTIFPKCAYCCPEHFPLLMRFIEARTFPAILVRRMQCMSKCGE